MYQKLVFAILRKAGVYKKKHDNDKLQGLTKPKKMLILIH